MHNLKKKTNLKVGCMKMTSTTTTGISSFPLLPQAPMDEKEVVFQKRNGIGLCRKIGHVLEVKT